MNPTSGCDKPTLGSKGPQGTNTTRGGNDGFQPHLLVDNLWTKRSATCAK